MEKSSQRLLDWQIVGLLDTVSHLMVLIDCEGLQGDQFGCGAEVLVIC